jgi:hypothetical protein
MTKTTIHPDKKGTDRVWQNCGKCGGSGNIPAFGHVLGGVCFDCNGTGGRGVLVSSLRVTARRRERAAEKAAAELAAKQAARTEWEAANADLLATIKANADRDHFLRQWAHTVQVPTAEVLETIDGILAELAAEDERKANAVPVAEGRGEVVGEVLTVKTQDSFYGYGRVEVKMLVADDRGFKVWGTLPAALADANRGSRVRFTATLQQSRDDEAFGFFKRPAKAELLAG